MTNKLHCDRKCYGLLGVFDLAVMKNDRVDEELLLPIVDLYADFINIAVDFDDHGDNEYAKRLRDGDFLVLNSVVGVVRWLRGLHPADLLVDVFRAGVGVGDELAVKPALSRCQVCHALIFLDWNCHDEWSKSTSAID